MLTATLFSFINTSCEAWNTSHIVQPYNDAIQANEYDFADFCCSPDSIMTDKVQRRHGRGYRFNLENGFDLFKFKDAQRAYEWIFQHRPRESWFSIPCRYWSSAQNGQHKDPFLWQKVLKGRLKSRVMIRNCEISSRFLLRSTALHSGSGLSARLAITTPP